MYNEDLESIKVSLNNLFLDPNNPRFWSEREIAEVRDSKIPDEKAQQDAQRRIREHGIEELYYSMLRNGYLPLDTIVVRPINGHGGKYVVVEGNRRLAALKMLLNALEMGTIEEEGIDEDYLDRLEESINDGINVLVYKGTDTDDISWLLQGIRHISGIRPWQPAQRAKLVAQRIEKDKMSFAQAGQQFGLSAKAVGRLYRAYKGLEQMRSDDEYGSKSKNEYFSLFEEAYRNKVVRDWLSWDDKLNEFTNNSNIKQFYSWIVPDDEQGNKRRMHDPKHVSILAGLLEKERQDLLGQIDRYEVSVEEAKGFADASPTPRNWKSELKQAQKVIINIPLEALVNAEEELVTTLREIRDFADNLLSKYQN